MSGSRFRSLRSGFLETPASACYSVLATTHTRTYTHTSILTQWCCCSLQCHGPKHARLLCPPRSHVHRVGDAIQLSHPLSPPSPALNSAPHQDLFQWVWLFTSGGQSIGASASVLPVNSQGWFPLGLTGLISLVSQGLSRVVSSTTIWKHQFFGFLYDPTLTSLHDYWENHRFDYTNLCRQTMSLLFNPDTDICKMIWQHLKSNSRCKKVSC